MDERVGELSSISIKISGYGYTGRIGQNPTEWNAKKFLKERKSVKLMSKQDRMALTAAYAAAEMAGLKSEDKGPATGLYICTGQLPFEQKNVDLFHDVSTFNGVFDFERFSTTAYDAMNPLLTFQCLPNMPVFHISYNLDIEGPYYISYPGQGEWFTVLERAIQDLVSDKVKNALVCAVSDQENFLFEKFIQRVFPDQATSFTDSATAFVLTLNTPNPIGEIHSVSTRYRAYDPFAGQEFFTQKPDPTLPTHDLIQRLDSKTVGSWEYMSHSDFGALGKMSGVIR